MSNSAEFYNSGERHEKTRIRFPFLGWNLVWLGASYSAMEKDSMSPIKLECVNCKRSMDYDRSIDPSVPDEVVRISQPHCDECWNGDREDESWYDANGKEVPQWTH